MPPSFPPSLPVNATVTMPSSCAAAAPRSTLGELPLVENCDRDVPAATESPGLARKYLFVTIVVAHAGEYRGVRRQGDGRERTSLEAESTHKFRGDVLRVRRAAAIAEEQNFPSLLHSLTDLSRQRRNPPSLAEKN